MLSLIFLFTIEYYLKKKYIYDLIFIEINKRSKKWKNQEIQ